MCVAAAETDPAGFQQYKLQITPLLEFLKDLFPTIKQRKHKIKQEKMLLTWVREFPSSVIKMIVFTLN